MIGVARLIMNQDLTSGEVAVLVQDRFQGKHLGSKFVEMLIGIARERGLEEVRADVLTENEKMLNVFKRLGFTTQWVPGGTSEAVLKLKEQRDPSPIPVAKKTTRSCTKALQNNCWFCDRQERLSPVNISAVVLADVQQRKGNCQHIWFYLFRHGLAFRGEILGK